MSILFSLRFPDCLTTMSPKISLKSVTFPRRGLALRLEQLLAQLPESLCRLGVDGVRYDIGRDVLLGTEVDGPWGVQRRNVVVLQVDTADVGEQRAGCGEYAGAGALLRGLRPAVGVDDRLTGVVDESH